MELNLIITTIANFIGSIIVGLSAPALKEYFKREGEIIKQSWEEANKLEKDDYENERYEFQIKEKIKKREQNDVLDFSGLDPSLFMGIRQTLLNIENEQELLARSIKLSREENKKKYFKQSMRILKSKNTLS